MNKNISNETISKKIAFAKTYGNSNCSITEQLNISEKDKQILQDEVIKSFPGIVPAIEENCDKGED